jgi:hypothetical protein
VEDIKPDLAELLLSEFPETVNQEFFMNNMVRFDSCLVTDESIKRLRHTMSARHHGPQLEDDPADSNVKLSHSTHLGPEGDSIEDNATGTWATDHVLFHVDKAYGKMLPAKVWQWMVRRILKRLEVFSKTFQDLEAQKLE